MVRQGIVFMGVDAGWVKAVLGAMLLIAVLVNRYVRTRAMGARADECNRDDQRRRRSLEVAERLEATSAS